jgi:hypothetical protein
MVITDHNIDVKPVISNFYSETSRAEDNPWRLLFHSGTAGVLSNTFCIDRLKSGASYQFLRLNSNAPLLKIASTHNDIDTLIEILKPSMSQIAIAFGVTRQWVYAWKNGRNMSPIQSDRMGNILAAANYIYESIPTLVHKAADRKLIDGRSFWEAVGSGVKPHDAANKLVLRIKREDKEREAIKRSLAGRSSKRDKQAPLFSARMDES